MTTADRRVAIFSQRAIRRDVSRCSGYEFEDVVTALEGARLHIAERPPSREILMRARRWSSKRTRLFEWVPSGAVRAPLGEDVDLFGCFVQKPVELLALDAVPDWRARSRLAFCVLEELWLTTIDDFRPLVASLGRFDLIACAFESSCARVAELTGRPVIHLPGAADLLRFAPPIAPPERVIDLHYMGRRRPELHAQVKAVLDARRRFYLYDSAALPPVVEDHVLHRELLASLIQRARLFMVDYGKIGHADQRRGQLIWGPRHVEGMAGGAVQVGYAPDSPDYHRHFDWPEAVERLPEHPTEAARAIMALLEDPQEQERRRRVNLVHALGRHDWLHRWALILGHFGLPETQAMTRRRERLTALARAYSGGIRAA
ncbi:glycosyltransferase family 1 protein [Halovulum dunhuangense]|uniref:Glycosyltransferase family 1 protein n=1 Tax=Halovulum dunhuangense TaxID=1505036 RepID=A0A849L216_9RHOB|nr:glycosyltransferase [Halovulum dunhuangense]NNU80313.1 glycosyltransferase family 1 protein [Halovulum dunhuangense]